jgi:hypothetical protein
MDPLILNVPASNYQFKLAPPDLMLSTILQNSNPLQSDFLIVLPPSSTNSFLLFERNPFGEFLLTSGAFLGSMAPDHFNYWLRRYFVGVAVHIWFNTSAF